MTKFLDCRKANTAPVQNKDYTSPNNYYGIPEQQGEYGNIKV